jgi:glycosyltransferase involved in cell wall biosynthesis
MWCRRHGRRSVYSVASNPACAAGLAELGSFRERVLYQYGLTHADSVIVQTHEQQQMLREGFGIASTVVPMPCEGLAPGDDHPPDLRPAAPAHVLRVGRISQEKRFEWLLDVAQRCPEICFDVVGASNVNSDYASALVARSATRSGWSRPRSCRRPSILFLRRK